MIEWIVIYYFAIAFLFSIYVCIDIKEDMDADPRISWVTIPLNGLLWPYHIIRWLIN